VRDLYGITVDVAPGADVGSLTVSLEADAIDALESPEEFGDPTYREVYGAIGHVAGVLARIGFHAFTSLKTYGAAHFSATKYSNRPPAFEVDGSCNALAIQAGPRSWDDGGLYLRFTIAKVDLPEWTDWLKWQLELTAQLEPAERGWGERKVSDLLQDPEALGSET
jgi:hypothetical protein